VVLRSKARGAALFDFLAFLPVTVPPIVFSVAALLLALFVLGSAVPLYGTIWLLVIVYVIARLSYGTRMTNSALIQIHRELDEAAQMSGAGTAGVRVTMMSFSMAAVRRVRHLAPDLPTVLLVDLLPPWLRTGRLPAGIPAAGPGVRLLRNHPRLAARIREQGNQLYVRTVNTDEDIDLVLALGVDGIITDRPRYVLDRLGR